MPDEPTEKRRPSATGLALGYVLGLIFAQLITAAEVAAVVISLSTQIGGAIGTLLTRTNLMILIGLLVFGLAVTAAGGYWSITPSLRWFVAGAEPTPAQQRNAVNIVRRQTSILFGTWVICGAVLIVANPQGGASTLAMLVVAILFGATSSFSASLLFAQRIYRPIVAAANREFTNRETAPGVVARLVMMWLANSALPSIFVALLIVAHS